MNKEVAKIGRTLSTFLTILLPLLLFFGSAAIDIAVSSIAVLFLVNSCITKNYKWINDTWLKWAFALWVYSVIRSCFAYDPTLALSASLPFCRFFIFAAALYSWILVEKEARDYLLKSLIFTVALVSINSILQYFWGYNILGGKPVDTGHFLRLTTFSGKMSVGIILASINFVITSWCFEKLKDTKANIKAKTFYLLLIILPFAAIFFSGERTAFLITILGYAILLIKNNNYKSTILFSLAFVALVTTVIATQSKFQVLDRQIKRSVEEIHKFEESSYGRIFHTGVAIYKENTIFGIGPKHFQQGCNSILYKNPNYFCSTHPHNIFMQMLVELGAIGFSLFTIMLFFIFKNCYNNRNKLIKDSIAFGAFLCFASKYIPIISTSSYFIAWSVVPSWFMLGILFSRFKNAKN